MVNADEALALALAREEGADNQEAILASVHSPQAGASTPHPTGPAAADSSDDDLEYASDESATGLASSAPPDPYAPIVEPLRPLRPRPLPPPPVEAPRPAPLRVPDIIITPETPAPPETPSSTPAGAGRESLYSRRASTETLPPYTSRVPSMLLPPEYDASTRRESLPPHNHHAATVVGTVDGQPAPSAPRAAKSPPAPDWWRESLPLSSSARRRNCVCGSRVYSQILKERYTPGTLWQRLLRESHARCRSVKPNCSVNCSGCGKIRAICTFRSCHGSDPNCSMLSCCPQVRALALQSTLDIFEREARVLLSRQTLPTFDAIIRHEGARDLVLEVLRVIHRLLDLNIAQTGNDERARAALRWLVQSSTLFDAAWTLFLPFNKFAATDSTLEHVYRTMLGFMRLLRRAELISSVDAPMCAVEFSRPALELWLADTGFASHLPELFQRPERRDVAVADLLTELRDAHGALARLVSSTVIQSTHQKATDLMSAIDDLLVEYDEV
ncbi:hypothetical protein K525DRAFT_281706 [Schizophyllum commune Loenen D]|nr:hypothetical protein K525DRAFT_281706 [Schizophyllum commune Loenen D]